MTTLEEVLECSAVLYKRQVSEDVHIRICQARDGAARAQFMHVVITTPSNGWISLRLSAFRAVWRAVVKLGWGKARRLAEGEKRALDRDWDKKER